MYILNLAEDNRILSAGVVLEGQNYDGQVIVNELPDDTDGKWVSDYYYIDGEYIYDPLPRPEEPDTEPIGDEATTDELAAAIMEGVNAV